MAEFIEDGECPLPSLASLSGPAECEVHIAKASEGVGLALTVAEFAIQKNRLLIMGDCLFVVPDSAIGGGNAVKRVRLAVLVRYLPLQIKSLLAVRQSSFVVAQLDVKPAECVHAAGLPGAVARGLEQLKRLLSMVQRLCVQILPVEDQREAPVSLRLADVITESLVQRKRLD
jgi:hypothetical protein